mgnify:CR=1 FL=1
MNSKYPGRVEDYTTANLVLIFVNMLWIFGAIWATWGILPVIVLAVALNHMITRLEILRERRDAPYRARADK